jgi:hypothetical protein
MRTRQIVQIPLYRPEVIVIRQLDLADELHVVESSGQSRISQPREWQEFQPGTLRARGSFRYAEVAERISRRLRETAVEVISHRKRKRDRQAGSLFDRDDDIPAPVGKYFGCPRTERCAMNGARSERRRNIADPHAPPQRLVTKDACHHPSNEPKDDCVDTAMRDGIRATYDLGGTRLTPHYVTR